MARLRLMSMAFAVLFIMWLCSVSVDAATNDDNDGLDGLNFDTLASSIPKLAKQVGKQGRTKVCQDQLKKMQEIAENSPERFSTREGIVGVLCVLSRACAKEIVTALKKSIVGGEKKITDLIESKLGFSLPLGADLETLVLLYYDAVCDGRSDQPQEDSNGKTSKEKNDEL